MNQWYPTRTMLTNTPSFKRLKAVAMSLKPNPYRLYGREQLEQAQNTALEWLGKHTEKHPLYSEAKRKYELLVFEMDRRESEKEEQRVKDLVF